MKKTRVLSYAAALMAFVISFVFASVGRAESIQTITPTPFDWRAAWGDIDLEKDEDKIIPAARHGIKQSLKTTIKYCLNKDVSPDELQLYTADINNDGINDFILDTKNLEGKLSPDCPEKICKQGEGCFVVAYITGPVSQIIEAPPEEYDDKGVLKPVEACPETPALNAACRADCPAAREQCPQLFNYDYRIAYTKRVKSWSLMAAEMFPPTENARPSPYLAGNENIVMGFEQQPEDCYYQEIQFNNGKCTKHLQWSGAYAEGFLRDIFRVYLPPVTTDNEARFTAIPFSREYSTTGQRGIAMGDGTGFRLEAKDKPGSFVALQLPAVKTGAQNNAEGFVCFEMQNTTAQTLFVPTKTDTEIRAFVNNPPTGVSVRGCQLKYTDWTGGPFFNGDATTGVLGCEALSGLPCHTEQEIFAERYCMRSTGSLASCNECASGLEYPELFDSAKDNEFGKQTVGSTGKVTTAQRRSVHLRSPVATDTTSTARNSYRQSTTAYRYYEALFNALKTYDPNLYKEMMAYAADHKAELVSGYNWYMKIYYNTCVHENEAIRTACSNLIFGQRIKVIYEQESVCQRSALCHISTNCTHGASCLPSHAKILMADGTERAIGEIKVGDSVMAFTAKDASGALAPAKVAAIKLTHDQPLIVINETELTPNHPVALADGRVVRAAAIMRGDQLLGKDGSALSLTKITRYKKPASVFNLDIEGADGFVANGIRVLDEEMQKKINSK